MKRGGVGFCDRLPRYTWAPKGQQPEVKSSGSSGKRKAYKVFGLIDDVSGGPSTKVTPQLDQPRRVARIEVMLLRPCNHKVERIWCRGIGTCWGGYPVEIRLMPGAVFSKNEKRQEQRILLLLKGKRLYIQQT